MTFARNEFTKIKYTQKNKYAKEDALDAYLPLTDNGFDTFHRRRRLMPSRMQIHASVIHNTVHHGRAEWNMAYLRREYCGVHCEISNIVKARDIAPGPPGGTQMDKKIRMGNAIRLPAVPVHLVHSVK
jgi:hypothetical protein